jgi:hypothetical protein
MALVLLALAMPAASSAAAPTYTLKIAPDEFDVRQGDSDVSTPAQVVVTENGGPVTQATTVQVQSSNPSALTVTDGGVTIPAGQTSAPIRVSGITQTYDVTLTATLGSLTATAHGRVLGATEPVPEITVTPFDTPSAPTGSQQTFTAHFDNRFGGGRVSWSVSGANPATSSVDTTTSSTSTFSYTGSHAGIDTITVCYDAYADGGCDNTKHAHITWVAPEASAAPGSLDFPTTLVGQTSPAQDVAVTNTGSVPLHVGAGSIVGAAADEFATPADGCSGTTVAVGASCTVSVAFAPTRAGAASAHLHIPDDSATSPHDVALSGVAAGPQTQPVTPVLPPSNAFRLVKVTAMRRTGQLRLTVRTAAPGVLTLKTVRAGRTIASRKGRTSGNVNTTFTLKPKRWTRKLLRRRHRLAAKLRVTFVPDGGVARRVARPVSFRLVRG